MEILPENEVRLYKNVPFYIDYKNVILFDNSAKQTEYFNSLPHIDFQDVTYTRPNGSIKVNAERDSLLEYNYMSFTNHNYTNKNFYAFITGVEYINPNTTLVRFIIDEWQTWCFDLTFKDSFIERKHCKRWNSDGTPVINTQDEGLDIGSEYIVKDHKEYNNNLYWVCFVSSDEQGGYYLNNPDVPTILNLYYAPIYKTTSNTTIKWTLNGSAMTDVTDAMTSFRDGTNLVNKLKSAFIISEPPFAYSYSISNNTINITANNVVSFGVKVNKDSTKTISLGLNNAISNPANYLRTFPKYGNLKNGITESKLLMYPYSFVQLVDGGGNTFDIKNEYLDDTQINVRTFTSGGLNSKQAHIVEHYRYKGITLNYCRWELGNGIINSFPNNLTVIDDYSAAYLQGHANQLQTSITNTQNQMRTNVLNASASAMTNARNSLTNALTGSTGSMVQAGEYGSYSVPAHGRAGDIAGISAANTLQSTASYTASGLSGMINAGRSGGTSINNVGRQGRTAVANMEASVLAKKRDAQTIADNVALQGGDVYFTFQNQYNGYCLVYKQISSEYITILENYFKQFGYAYNRLEVPNLHTRKSWDYIKTIDCNIKANINNDSLNIIKSIFDSGVTIWHTTDVDNYNLNNDEI